MLSKLFTYLLICYYIYVFKMQFNSRRIERTFIMRLAVAEKYAGDANYEVSALHLPVSGYQAAPLVIPFSNLGDPDLQETPRAILA